MTAKADAAGDRGRGVILALDQATRTGWALGPADGPVTTGAFTLPRTGHDIAAFLFAFEDWLDAKIRRDQPEAILFEQPVASRAKLNLATMRKLYGLANEIEKAARRHQLPCYEIKTGEAKKTAYGKAGKKPENAAALIKRWGIPCGGADEADAAAVWLEYVRLADPRAFDAWLKRRAAG